MQRDLRYDVALVVRVVAGACGLGVLLGGVLGWLTYVELDQEL